MASITSVTARCLGLGNALMRSRCCISFGAGPRLRAAAFGAWLIKSSTLTANERQQRQHRHLHAPLA